jgi:hypothetical protein
MRYRTARTVLTLGAAFVALLAGGSAAQAETTWTGVNYAGVAQTTDLGTGWAQVDWNAGSKTTPAYAYAYIDNGHTGFALKGWLERDHDGEGWQRISDYHYLDDTGSDTHAETDQYYDGPGYLARACFQFTSWAGAATHCTPAI